MNLNGKVAWVLGASSGIGAAVARELASRGGTVAISARREEQLREVSEGRMLVVPLDVTDTASVVAAAARVHQELGPIDLAVLSAGYWKQMDPADWDTDVFDQHIRVNLTEWTIAPRAVLARRQHGDAEQPPADQDAGQRYQRRDHRCRRAARPQLSRVYRAVRGASALRGWFFLSGHSSGRLLFLVGGLCRVQGLLGAAQVDALHEHPDPGDQVEQAE
jgi:NAD(P)-dependent dehydrogenase (short-subunit alcohol dehydrogenase family)